jgi:hypothetical protein
VKHESRIHVEQGDITLKISDSFPLKVGLTPQGGVPFCDKKNVECRKFARNFAISCFSYKKVNAINSLKRNVCEGVKKFYGLHFLRFLRICCLFYVIFCKAYFYIRHGFLEIFWCDIFSNFLALPKPERDFQRIFILPK